MGKAKRRSIALGRHNQISNLSRNDAIISVVEKLSKQEEPEFGFNIYDKENIMVMKKNF